MSAQLEHGYLFITNGGTRVIGAIPPRCSRSREIEWEGGERICVRWHLHTRGIPLRASTRRECERRLFRPRRRYAITRVIRFTDNGAPLASVCPSASPDTLAKLIRRNGDAKYTYTVTRAVSLSRAREAKYLALQITRVIASPREISYSREDLNCRAKLN